MNKWFIYDAHTQSAKSYYEIAVSKIKELEAVRLLEDTYDFETPTDDYISISVEKV